jgi:F0F1-type ATP synthase assembly protein I
VQSVHSDFREQDVKTATQAERLEREAEEAAARARDATSKKAKAKAQGIRKNADNPVYIGNAVIAAAVGAGLGYGAYQKHTEGKLSWELAGVWVGAVGLFAGVDYFVSKYVHFLYITHMYPRAVTNLSRWLIQNKYPKKD